MDWLTLDEAAVASHLPTDLAAQYQAWVAANPDKANRLAQITANTVAEVRDNIRSNPANTLDPDTTKIPQSVTRHAESIIFFQLSMEMGLDIAPEGTQSMTRADMFLRQISYSHFTTTGGDAAEGPSPGYTVPDRLELPRRALPLLLALSLILPSCKPMYAGWIANKQNVQDTSVAVTYSPQRYTNSNTQLYGHLQGIDQFLAALIPFITNQGGSGAFLALAGGNLNGELGLQGHDIQSVRALSFTDSLNPPGPLTPEVRQYHSNLYFRSFMVASSGNIRDTLPLFLAVTFFTPTNNTFSGVFAGIDAALARLQPAAIAGPGLGLVTNGSGIVQLTVTNAP